MHLDNTIVNGDVHYAYLLSTVMGTGLNLF